MTTPVTEDTRLGQLLLEEQRITPSQYNTAQEYHASIGGRFANVLIKLGFISNDEAKMWEQRLRAVTPAAARARAGDPTDNFGAQLINQIADPVVAALARALLKTGVVNALAWQAELDRG